MKQRIWELDAFRGICVLGMVLVHLLYDIGAFGGASQIFNNPLFVFTSSYGGILFVLISGIAVTFSRSSVKRGVLVLACGLAVTIGTAGMYFLNMATASIIIYFGVLHCLGVCMLLWPLCKRLPNWALAVVGVILIVAGYYLQANVRVSTPLLIPFGILTESFQTSDYFPLMPNLGYFLLGAVLGRTVYKNQTTLLPRVNENFFLLRFFRFCGRHSLIIYLAHQPLLTGLVSVLTIFKN